MITLLGTTITPIGITITLLGITIAAIGCLCLSGAFFAGLASSH